MKKLLLFLVFSTSLFNAHAQTASITITNGGFGPSISSLSALSTCQGNVSSQNTFTVQGSNLTSNIVVVAPTGYEVALSSAGTPIFLSSVSISKGSGFAFLDVHIRLKGTSAGSFSGNVSFTTTGATKTVSISGTVHAQPSLGNYVNTTIVNNIANTITPSAAPSNAQSVSVGLNVSFFNVPWLTVNSSTGKLTVSSGIAAGTYQIQVRATNSGCPDDVDNFTLTIVDPPTLSIKTIFGSPLSSLSPFSTCQGTLSNQNVFLVTGNDLIADVNVSAPSGYEIALSVIGTPTFSSSVTIPKGSGSVFREIHVRLKGTSAGSFSGNITCSTSGVTKNLAVSGTVGAQSSLGNYANTTITNNVANAITPSAIPTNAQSVSVGLNTFGFIVVPWLTVNASTGKLTVSSGVSAGTYSVQVKSSSNGCPDDADNFTLTIVDPPTLSIKTIFGSPISSLSPFSTCQGTVSPQNVFLVTGNDLIADVSVSAPSGYEVALSVAGTPTFSSSVTIPKGSGSVFREIHVRLKGTSAGSFSGNITCSTSGVTKNLDVSGTVGAQSSLGNYVNTTITNNVANAITPSAVPTNAQSVSVGLTSTFFPVPWLTVNSTTGKLTVSSGIAAGTYTVQVRATNSGCPDDVDNFTLTIVDPPSLSIKNMFGGAISSIGPLSSCQGMVSSQVAFLVTGSDLIADVNVSAPSGYEVALSVIGTPTFSSSVTIPKSSGSIFKEVYVRLKGTSAGSFSGNITCSTTGVSKTLPVSGAVDATVSLGNYPNTIMYVDNFTTISPSSVPSNATAISVSENVLNNLYLPSTFFTVNATSGVLSAAANTPAGEYKIRVSLSNPGCGTINRDFTLEILEPTINIFEGLWFDQIVTYTTCEGFPSSSNTVFVSGNDLTEPITITPPTGYEISKGWSSYTTESIVLYPSKTTKKVAASPISIRLIGSTSGVVNGNLIAESPTAVTKTLALVGKVNANPTVNAGMDIEECQKNTPTPITLSGASYGNGATSATWSHVVSGGWAFPYFLNLETLSNYGSTTNPASVTYKPLVFTQGDVTLELSVVNKNTGCIASDRRIVTIKAPTVDAGLTDTLCKASSAIAYNLKGSSFGGSAVSAAWSINSGGGSLSTTAKTASPSTVSYTPPSNFTGTIELKLKTYSGSGCKTTSQKRTIEVIERPTVSAGSKLTDCQSIAPQGLQLSGASFGGGAHSASWEIISGEGILSTTDLTNNPASVVITQSKNYVGNIQLRLTSNASGECVAATANRTIEIKGPTVNAGGADTTCVSSNPNPITLSGASFDGEATKAAWSIVSGGGALSSTSLTSSPQTVTYTPAANYQGDVVLLLTTNTGSGTLCTPATSERHIYISEQPSVIAGGPNSVCESSNPLAITLYGSSFGNNASTAGWSIISGGGVLSNTSQTSSPSYVTYAPASNYSGIVKLKLTTNSRNGCVAATANRTIFINEAPTSIAGDDIEVCESQTPTPITLNGASVGGSATSGTWSIVSGIGALSNSTQSANPENVTYTPTSGYSGTVTLKLTSNAKAGCSAAEDTRLITINSLPSLTAGGPDNISRSTSPDPFGLSGSLLDGTGSTASWSIVSGGGSLSSTSSTTTPEIVSYTPQANYSGEVKLRLTASSSGNCGDVEDTRILNINATPNAGRIPYQGVARTASGEILALQNISLRLSIHNVTASGTIVYQETHNVTTTSLGLFNILIGQGSPSIGTFKDVNWARESKFIQVEFDAAGGNSYVDMGTTQLNSVPYALYAETANVPGLPGPVGPKGPIGLTGPQGPSGFLPNGSASGNTPYWSGLSSSWVTNSNNIFNNGENVGIGTNIPSQKLDVNGIINSSLGFRIANKPTGDGTFLRGDGDHFVAGRIQADDLPDLSLAYVDFTSDQIVSGIKTWEDNAIFNSRVGIGTDIPETELHVSSETKATATINSVLVSRWARPSTNGVKFGNTFDLFIGSYGTKTTSQTRVDFKLSDGLSSNTDRTVLSLLGNGRVGIGTSTPDYLFTLSTSSSSFIAKFENTNASNGDGIIIKLGKQHPAWNGSKYLEVENPFTTVLDIQLSQLRDWIEDPESFKLEQVFNLIPAELVAGTACNFGNMVIGIINDGMDLPWNLPYPVPNVPKLPDLPCGGLPSIEPPVLSFTNISNRLTGKNQFMSFVDSEDRELGSIKAMSVTDWQSNTLSNEYLIAMLGDIIGFDGLSSVVGMVAGFSDLVESYNSIGVEYASGHGDYAEWLERENPIEIINQGDIVAVKGGKITKNLSDAEQILVVSKNPIILGNAPTAEDDYLGNKIAFMGQVPVKVIGAVYAGDYIVANLEMPGFGTAINPEHITKENLEYIVGRSWETNENPGFKMVNTLVGVDNGDYIRILKKDQDKLNELEMRLKELEDKIDRVLLIEAALPEN